MDKLAHDIPILGRIELAREPDFALGGATVRPSRREVIGHGERHVLQRRVMQVLVALARSPNEVVSQRELVGRCWEGLSVSEDAIGRCIGQLRRLASAWGEPPFAIETIPGVGYRINPRALETRPKVRIAAEARRFSWRLAGLVGAAVLIGVGFAAWWFVGRPAEGTQAVPYPTVAVTPFQPADGSPAAKAYAATLAGEISDQASRYNLVVIRPANVQARSQGKTVSMPGADFLVTGRIIQRGGGPIVTSDLVDARHGVVVYSFDAPVTPKADIAAVIAARIAHALDPSKLTNDLAGKLSPSDYTLVARANEAIDRWDTAEALGEVRTLAARHPDDGDLQASLAISEIYDALSSPSANRRALISGARASLARAARLRPNSALLHIAREMFLGGPLAWAAQERELRRAIQLEPNLHVAFDGLADTMLSVGRTKAGVALFTRSIQLDPMSEIVIGGAGLGFIQAGATDEANDALQREETLWPDHVETAREVRYLIAFFLGAPKDVLAVVAENPAPIHHSVPAAQREAMLAALTTRDPAAIRRMVAQCFANYGRSGDQVGDRECLVEMVERGALDDAFRFAELAYPDHRHLYSVGSDGWVVNPPLGLDPAWLFTPKMKPFREDPRFWDVALRTGLVAYWRSTGAWPDMCRDRLAFCQSLAARALASDEAAGRRVS